MKPQEIKKWGLDFCAKEARNYLGGTWKGSTGKDRFACINPATEEELATYNIASKKDVDEAVKHAKACFVQESWTRMSMRDRANRLREIGAAVRKHQAELAVLETLANGKLYSEAFADDIPDCADIFDYYAGWIGKHTGDWIPTEDSFVNFSTREPLGVCALIAPWNFPLLLACWKIAPALAAGNAIVVKPSEFTPFSLLRFFELIHDEVDLPKGLINLVLGDGSVGQMLTQHSDVNKVSFTGSTAVGKKIVEASAHSNLKSVTLELGGKSPNIIFDDVPDLEAALLRSRTVMFSHKGEKCSEPTRFLVHEKIYDKVANHLVNFCKSVKCGDPFASESQQGPQCNQNQFKKVLSYFDIAKTEKLKLLVGGTRDEKNKKGYFVRPTIYESPSAKSRLVQEEIFGPVLVMTPFKSEEQAVEMANATRYGLAAGLWTSDLSRAMRVSKALDAGMVFVNRYGCYDFPSPFGGFRESGWGKEMARESMDAYTKSKSIWIKYER